MHFLPLYIFLFFTLSSVCQAAQMLPKEPSPVKSLKATVLEKYPQHTPYSILLKGDKSDLALAVTLGFYLFHHESELLLTLESAILVDAAKLETILCERLIGTKVDYHNPLNSLEKELGAFVKNILSTDRLKTEITERKRRNLSSIKLLELHQMIGRCAKNQLAVVSIDVAILKWVVLSARNEKIKPHIFKGLGLYPPIVDTLLCNSLISLMFHPEVHLHVESEMNEFMGLLKGLSKEEFDFYGSRIACLLLPLPKNYHSKVTPLVSECASMTVFKDIPNVHFSEMVISLSDLNVECFKIIREKYKMHILLGAYMELLSVGIEPDFLNVSNYSSFYFGTLINGQFQNEGLKLVENYELVVLSFRADRIGEGCDVFVCSLVSLTADVLRVLSLYARGVNLSNGDQEILGLAQAAFGITMITASQILILTELPGE